VTEFRPWLEAGDAPAHLRDLLVQAQPSQPLDARTQVRSKRRLLAMSALPAAAGVIFWVKNIALGAVLGGAVATVVYAPKLRQMMTKPEAPARQPAPTAAHSMRSIPVAIDASVEAAEPPPVAPVVGLAPARRSVATLPSAEPSQLSRETQLLERARQLIGSNASQALRALDAHRREFPHGALELEREFMAVDALLRLGQRDAAQRRAAQLRAQAPGSIYEQRLQRLLEQNSESP